MDGEDLVGPPEPINPFVNQGPMQGPPEPGKFEQYKQGWKSFFQRVKTDPNAKLAVLQMAVGATKPAGTNAEGIGNAIEAGLNTVMGLKNMEYERGRQARAETRADRGVAVEEKKADADMKKVTQQGEQFSQNLDQQRRELDARLKEIENTDAFHKAQIGVEWAKVNKGTGEGQVNDRIKNVQQALLQDPDADLAGISDPKQRENRAFLRAFDLVNKPSQTRQQFIGKFLADQQLFMADPKKQPDKYAQDMQNAVSRATAIADAAGLTESTATPKGAPIGPNATAGTGAGGQLPSRPIQVGQSIRIASGGQPIEGKITALTNETATVEFPAPVGTKVLKRSAVEGSQSVQQ